MSESGPVEIAVVIAASNEAANIESCIDSVRWAREIIVVENGSSDTTVERAQRAGAMVFSNPFETIGHQRNAAIGRATAEWVLAVDADERGSPGLAAEIRAVIAAAAHDAYRVPRRNFFLGREMRHGGWERDRPIRLFRASLRYNASRVHESVETTGTVGALKAPLLHFTYATIDDYFEKLNRYSKWWAEDRFARGKRAGPGSVIVRPPVRFLTMYVLKGGWMDGAAGAVLACLASASVMAKYARLWLLSREDGS